MYTCVHFFSCCFLNPGAWGDHGEDWISEDWSGDVRNHWRQSSKSSRILMLGLFKTFYLCMLLYSEVIFFTKYLCCVSFLTVV